MSKFDLLLIANINNVTGTVLPNSLLLIESLKVSHFMNKETEA